MTEIKENKVVLEHDIKNEQLISILAHDLKNPFTALIGFSELLNSSFLQGDKKETLDCITIINQTLWQTYRMLEDILLWSKVHSGKLSCNFQKINLKKIVQEITESMIVTANINNINIEYFVNDEIDVFADIDMLKAILRNLILYSFKSTNHGDTMKIVASIDENLKNVVKLNISNGRFELHPTHENFRDNSFEVSFDTKISSCIDNQHPQDFGLIICKEFIEKHNGKFCIKQHAIKGQSDKWPSPDRSTFIFTIPLSRI
ncbi:MAG: HAMP domain-containing histidine kinase [Oligoflexia bacterium]|nr:HAMP domain-containing histidine kinase [Oligoflexia bacterium]